jgi:hypothetical protein
MNYLKQLDDGKYMDYLEFVYEKIAELETDEQEAVVDKWASALHYRDLNPVEAARIIERGINLYFNLEK